MESLEIEVSMSLSCLMKQVSVYQNPIQLIWSELQEPGMEM